MCPLAPEQYDELMKAIAENRAIQEKMARERRLRNREVELCLEPAPDDQDVSESAFQAELAAFAKALRDTGVKYQQFSMALDAVDAVGYPLSEFILTLKELGPMAITAATAVCVAWVNARPGRKVRLKIGDVEAEGQTPEEIAKLLKQAQEFQSTAPTKSNDID